MVFGRIERERDLTQPRTRLIDMRLAVATHYAFHILEHLAANPERLCSVTEIAQAYRIPRNSVAKVVHGLAQSGVIRSKRGPKGGIQLALSPEDISIGRLIRITEPRFRVGAAASETKKLPYLTSFLRAASEALLADLDRRAPFGDL